MKSKDSTGILFLLVSGDLRLNPIFNSNSVIIRFRVLSSSSKESIPITGFGFGADFDFEITSFDENSRTGGKGGGGGGGSDGATFKEFNVVLVIESTAL